MRRTRFGGWSTGDSGNSLLALSHASLSCPRRTARASWPLTWLVRIRWCFSVSWRELSGED